MKQTIRLCVLTVASVALQGCDRPTNTPTGSSSGTTGSSTTTPPPRVQTTPAPDNTGTNRADKNIDAKTPLDQGQGTEDVRITAAIRRAILDDKMMATNAENCKIITDKGVVVLRGPVGTQAEKDSIEAKARAVAGVVRVENQLEVTKP